MIERFRPTALSHSILVVFSLLSIARCVPMFPPPPAELFTVPLTINGIPIGEAIVDTGGGYEVILSERHDLPLAGKASVLAFDGGEIVDVTGGFDYTVGNVADRAEFALVGSSVCVCNGLGFHFFRETGLILALDYVSMRASFVESLPAEGTLVSFADPPDSLARFDTSFVEVTVSSDGVSRTVLALLDTGTNSTVMRRGIMPDGSFLTPDRTEIVITQPQLGSVAATVRLFDTPGLPDLILGTDVMQAWSDRWYFQFDPQGGAFLIDPGEAESTPAQTLPR